MTRERLEISRDVLMKDMQNVFDAINRDGHDEDFLPMERDSFVPTDLAAGTPEKMELLRRRVEMGVPLWHERDRGDYEDLVGVIRPRSR
ncbi:MAG: hypothetical protein ACI8P0_006089 [Planctomycetaceae bacterium]|jgi:hypothetical protein